MLNLETTKDFLKYTLTLAGIGFVYMSKAKTSGLLPWEGSDFALRVAVGLLLGVLFLSSLFGIFALSGAVRYANEVAKTVTPAPVAGSVVAPVAPSDAAKDALATVTKYANWHLCALGVGFVGIGAFFALTFFQQVEPARRCTLTDLGQNRVTLEFDCTAKVAEAVKSAGGDAK
jgi:hypothetical protein